MQTTSLALRRRSATRKRSTSTPAVSYIACLRTLRVDVVCVCARGDVMMCDSKHGAMLVGARTKAEQSAATSRFIGIVRREHEQLSDDMCNVLL